MVKHAVYIALVGGQEVQKENIINSLIISSVLHDIMFSIILCMTPRTELSRKGSWY